MGRSAGDSDIPRMGDGQPKDIPSAALDGLGSGRRIIRNELNGRPGRQGSEQAVPPEEEGYPRLVAEELATACGLTDLCEAAVLPGTALVRVVPGLAQELIGPASAEQ